MREQIYQICTKCGNSFPKTREFFKRKKNPETGKEGYSCICRECEEQEKYEENWKDGKLKCFSCGEWLDPKYFDSHSQYKYRNHLDKRCKKCKLIQNRKARQNYSDEQKLYKTLQARVLNAKTRAKNKNIPCTITKDYILDLWNKQEGLCAISKIPMTYELDSGRVFTNVSIDQIRYGEGYTEDNVQLVCSAVNQLKSDWDIDTVLYICKQIINNN